MTLIHGTTDPPFQAVRDAFAANFRDHGEVGAALCVYHRGRRVVDLWGGIADLATGTPWAEDTLQYVFSTTKGFTATCAHLLVQRGELDLDAPVADYWPEFAATGKQHIPVRWLLSHRAGLPALDTPIPLADALAWHPMTTALAAQHPLWPPGSAHGYHAHTFGWLVGEVIRRITGRTPGTFFADDIATSLDLDAYIGLPPAHAHRVSRVIEPPAADHTDSTALRRASAVTTPRIDPNDPRVHAAEIPSSNGITTARTLARFYNALIDPTDGYPLLTPATLTTVTTVQSDALDQTLGVHTRFGLGYALPCTTFPILGAGSFGHGGRGGSLGAVHPHHRRLRHEPYAHRPHHRPPLHQPRRRHHHISLMGVTGPGPGVAHADPHGCAGSPARERLSGFTSKGELVMAKHEMPPQGSEQDGKAELDVAGLARLAKEPEGGQHSAAEDEADPDEAEE